MIKKLIISVVGLTALIVGKEANAAGPAGFARSLTSNFSVRAEIADLMPAVQRSMDAHAEKRCEAIRVSAPLARAVADIGDIRVVVTEGASTEPAMTAGQSPHYDI
jgi:hypothetical protein